MGYHKNEIFYLPDASSGLLFDGTLYPTPGVLCYTREIDIDQAHSYNINITVPYTGDHDVEFTLECYGAAGWMAKQQAVRSHNDSMDVSFVLMPDYDFTKFRVKIDNKAYSLPNIAITLGYFESIVSIPTKKSSMIENRYNQRNFEYMNLNGYKMDANTYLPGYAYLVGVPIEIHQYTSWEIHLFQSFVFSDIMFYVRVSKDGIAWYDYATYNLVNDQLNAVISHHSVNCWNKIQVIMIIGSGAAYPSICFRGRT